MSKKTIEYLDEVINSNLKNKKNLFIVRAINSFIVIFITNVLFSDLIEKAIVTTAIFAMLIYLKD